MSERTLISLCACYLNTNYMSANSVVELLGYDLYEYDVLGNEYDTIGQAFEEIMQPIKDKRLNFVDNNEADDGHLEYYSKKLAKQLNKLMKKLG